VHSAWGSMQIALTLRQRFSLISVIIEGTLLKRAETLEIRARTPHCVLTAGCGYLGVGLPHAVE
jgi:hypothetical protein